jgi:hypothetical protein
LQVLFPVCPRFVSVSGGVPVGSGVNVNLYEVTADFAELVPELVFS